MIVSSKEVVEAQPNRHLVRFYIWAVVSMMLCMTFIGAPVGVLIWKKKAYPAYSGGLTRRQVWHEQIRRGKAL
jgi:hypothetical protein